MHNSLDLTVCLLNWKRPENLDKIIDNLYGKVKIFLWDNSGSFKKKDKRVDWHVRSSVNKFFSPRWWMLKFAQTNFVCTHDDDFNLENVYVLQEAIDALNNDKEKKAAGFCGRILRGKPCEFTKTKAFNYYKPDDELKEDKKVVDFIAGRLILTHTNSIRNIELSNLSKINDGKDYHDDLDICAKLAKKRLRRFIIFKKIADSVIELPDQYAAWKTPDFFENAQKQLNNYWYDIDM